MKIAKWILIFLCGLCLWSTVAAAKTHHRIRHRVVVHRVVHRVHHRVVRRYRVVVRHHSVVVRTHPATVPTHRVVPTSSRTSVAPTSGKRVSTQLASQPLWIRESLTDIRLHIHRYAHPGGVVGFAIKDLSTGKHIAVNGQMSFNPASVIKVPVMVEAFRQAELGKIDMDETMVMRQDNKLTGSGGLQFLPTGSTFTIHRLIFQMITDSDNTATNMLIKKLGAANINATMRELGLRNTVIKDATLLCKLPGCHNTSSPEDMLLLMDKMYRHELVSADVCDQMLGIMEAQHHRWGIPRHLPPTVKIANKPGSLDYVRNDVGIVYAGSHPYILSIFSKNLPSNRRGTLLVASISRSVFEKRTGQIIKARG